MRALHPGSSYSSALPDYVFDEGERQPRQALRRPKTGKARVRQSDQSKSSGNLAVRLSSPRNQLEATPDLNEAIVLDREALPPVDPTSTV